MGLSQSSSSESSETEPEPERHRSSRKKKHQDATERGHRRRDKNGDPYGGVLPSEDQGPTLVDSYRHPQAGQPVQPLTPNPLDHPMAAFINATIRKDGHKEKKRKKKEKSSKVEVHVEQPRPAVVLKKGPGKEKKRRLQEEEFVEAHDHRNGHEAKKSKKDKTS